MIAITANQLLDACSASFFCLVGLWAGAARGHWFLRIAVAGGCLLVPLLASMHMVTIEFGLQIAVILLGVSWARRTDDWRPRFSMETALLTMVVVAVAAAVLRGALDWSLAEWVWALGVGLGTGLLGLVCLWTICGGARWYWRLTGFAAFVLVFFVGGLLVGGVRSYLWNAAPGASLWRTVVDHCSAENAIDWLSDSGMSIALGVVILLSAIVLGIHTGWFSQQNEQVPTRPPWPRWLARGVLASLVACVLMPLLYVMYRVMTPAPLPRYDPPTPNAFDEFVAAGNRVPDLAGKSLRQFDLWTARLDELDQLVADLAPVYEQIDRALERPCLAPRRSGHSGDQALAIQAEFLAIEEANSALVNRYYLAALTQTPREFLNATLQLGHFNAVLTHGQGAVDAIQTAGYGSGMAAVTAVFANSLWKLSPEECRSWVPRIRDYEQSLEPYAELAARQRTFDENDDWEVRIGVILDDWNVRWGHYGRYWWYWYSWKQSRAQLRLLTAQLALQAYWLERDTLPDALEELVPEYLDTVPADPFNDQPVRYRRTGNSYVLYSVGSNGVDDNGDATRDAKPAVERDIVVTGPALPPNWKRAVDALRPAVERTLRRAPRWLRAWSDAIQDPTVDAPPP